MISDREFTRRLIQTVAAVTTAVLLAALYGPRSAVLIYISSPRDGLRPLGPPSSAQKRQRPDRIRTLAILAIYPVIVGASYCWA
jgi:hypothetical protein